MQLRKRTSCLTLAASALISCPTVADEPTTGGKLLLTGGVSEIEDAARGGLTPRAVIGGYGIASQLGGNAHGGSDNHIASLLPVE
jgi:hypothetical protein